MDSWGQPSLCSVPFVAPCLDSSSHPTPAFLPPPGWSGWGCTDNAGAFSYGFQLLSTLLLCLSNLMFVPPVVIAVRSRYLLEAAVYIFTMFFSTVSACAMWLGPFPAHSLQTVGLGA